MELYFLNYSGLLDSICSSNNNIKESNYESICNYGQVCTFATFKLKALGRPNWVRTCSGY
jgi:hypothetical protein